MSVEIVEVTGSDEPGLRAWADVTARSARHEIGRDATAWSAEELIVVARHRGAQRRERFYAARLDGETLGTGWLAVPLLDNLTSAEIDVHVAPASRRRGIGSQLVAHLESVAAGEGRTRFNAEVAWPHDGPPDGSGAPGIGFAHRRGYVFGIGDVQRTLTLPVSSALLDDLVLETAPHHPSYRIEAWSGPVPDRLVESWLEVAASLNVEAPTGAMEREAESVDVAAFRDAEEMQARQARTAWHTVALDGSGRVVAYTQMILPAHDPDFVYQWGTLVAPAHRGHRLGTAVKVHNLRALQAGADVAGRRLVTWNAEVNEHMIGINERLGFVRTARLAELQKKVSAPA